MLKSCKTKNLHYIKKYFYSIEVNLYSLLVYFNYITFLNKTLTRGHRATEERIKDGALTEHRIIPGTLRRTTNCCGARRNTTEQNRAVRSTTFNLHFLIDLCYLFIINSIILWFYHFYRFLRFFQLHLVYIAYLIIDSWKKFS